MECLLRTTTAAAVAAVLSHTLPVAHTPAFYRQSVAHFNVSSALSVTELYIPSFYQAHIAHKADPSIFV